MGRADGAEPGCAFAAGTASPQSEFPPPPGSGLRRSRPAVIEARGEEGGTDGGRDCGGSFCALCPGGEAEGRPWGCRTGPSASSR